MINKFVKSQWVWFVAMLISMGVGVWVGLAISAIK